MLDSLDNSQQNRSTCLVFYVLTLC